MRLIGLLQRQSVALLVNSNEVAQHDSHLILFVETNTEEF